VATPDSGYAFDGWYENDAKISGASATYNFTATVDRTLEARFVPISSSNTYNITATAGIGGSVSGGGIFNENAAVTLVATPESGYAFDGWCENNTKVTGASATYSFTAMADRTLEARFVPITSSTTYTITVTAGIGGSVSGGGIFNENVAVTLIAAPNLGYDFDGWYENSAKVNGAAANYNFTATADRTLEARFVPISSSTTYTITAIAGVGGTVTGGGTYSENAAVTLIATPNSGYSFEGWFENGIRVSDTATYSFNAERNRTLTTQFTRGSGISSDPTGTSSSGSGGGSGSSGSTADSVKTATPQPLTMSEAKTAFTKALAEAKKANPQSVTVRFVNKSYISLEILQSLAKMAKDAGVTITVYADTVDNLVVKNRLFISPEKATNGIYFLASYETAYTTNIQNQFQRHFKNSVEILRMEQPGDFGMTIQIATKLNISKLNRNDLIFYSYNKSTNTYKRIVTADYWIDKNGYLRFKTQLAGDIIISEGPLMQKNIK